MLKCRPIPYAKTLLSKAYISITESLLLEIVWDEKNIYQITKIE
jgi:hypothetical protein